MLNPQINWAIFFWILADFSIFKQNIWYEKKNSTNFEIERILKLQRTYIEFHIGY